MTQPPASRAQQTDALFRAAVDDLRRVLDLLGDEHRDAVAALAADTVDAWRAGGTPFYAYDGAVESFTLGDAASTERAYVYDELRRVQNVQTYRAYPRLWDNPPSGSNYRPPSNPAEPTQQLLLEDYDFEYDRVGNITEISDWRVPDEWPQSAKPVTRRFQYDDLYRLIRTEYEYAEGSHPCRAERYVCGQGPRDNHVWSLCCKTCRNDHVRNVSGCRKACKSPCSGI